MQVRSDLSTVSDALARLSTVMETLLDTIDEAVTIVDGSGVVTHWNRAAEELYKISAAEIIGHHISDFEWKSLMVAKVATSGEFIRQAYHEPQPGIHVLVNTKAVLYQKQIRGVISSEQDITKLVRLGNELYSTSAQLHEWEAQVTKRGPSVDPFFHIKGNGIAISKSVQIANRVAITDATVLITGESGVGKELFAHAIHMASPRAKQKFIAINCGAIPSSLFESELFGYEPGAFTGARKQGQIGKIELADGGTLFLDEIGELPLEMQVKLLRVLQGKEFYRIGATEPTEVNVRVLAATNRQLESLIQTGQFREDLYYRLNVVLLNIPPLRERVEDIPPLIQLFTKDIATQYNKPIPKYPPEVIISLMAYTWPGNIRELRNVIERMVILTESDTLSREYLPQNIFARHQDFRQSSGLSTEIAARKAQEIPELERLRIALKTTFGNKTAAAKLLGVSRGTLYNQLRKYNLNNLFT